MRSSTQRENLGPTMVFSAQPSSLREKCQLALQRWLTLLPKKLSLGFERLNGENLGPMFVLIVNLVMSQLSTTIVGTLSNMLHNITFSSPSAPTSLSSK